MSSIREKLMDWGLDQTYLGHDYIVHAVGMLQQVEGHVQMKALYTDVAKQYSTSISCVERDMRTAFAVLWRCEEFCMFLHGDPMGRKPGNAKLLYLLARYWK